jgi:hypothetical protein
MALLAPAVRPDPLVVVSRFLKSLQHAEPRFFCLGMLMLFAIAPTTFAAFVDDRVFVGADIWLKPMKFEAALFVYLMSLAFYARFLSTGTTASRWYRLYGLAVAAAIVAEMVWIGGAAALGTASHFNRGPIGGILYSVMGVFAILLTTPTVVYAWLIARNTSAGLSPALKEGVVLGLGLTLPLTLITAGTMGSMDGHAIGGSGMAGLPIVGWARDGGDLRVSHFFATHALHFIPAFALVSTAWLGASRWPVRAFAAAFAAFVLWTFVQALMGQPFLPGLR